MFSIFGFFFFKNILNSDNIVMYFLYIDRFKIIDNIKIKYYIWWNNKVIFVLVNYVLF